ncbi:unnamed protein product, partial [Discosporangium mesarthrocarpum]
IIYIKSHKVGSSSMYNFLRMVAARYGGFENEYLLFNKDDAFYGSWNRQPVRLGFHLWSEHLPLREIVALSAPQVLEESFKLTLVREPVARCLSAFYYYTCHTGPRL